MYGHRRRQTNKHRAAKTTTEKKNQFASLQLIASVPTRERARGDPEPIFNKHFCGTGIRAMLSITNSIYTF